MKDVVCFGSALIDAFVDPGTQAYSSANEIRIPFGEKLLVKNITFAVGGGGTNAAVSLGRIGCRAGFVGKVGRGYNSQRVISMLKNEGVDISCICRKNCRTGYSLILDFKKKDRIILTFRGGNDTISYADLRPSKLKAKWFYLSSMVGKSFACLEQLSSHAKLQGSDVLFNPSSYLARRGKAFLGNILAASSILVMNKEEAGLLVGNGQLPRQLQKLYQLCRGIAIITDGRKGAYVYDGEEFFTGIPRKNKAVETTGAGDAFASAFLGALIKKEDVEFAIRAGMANAGSVVEHIGAKEGLLHWRTLLDRIDAERAHIIKKRLAPI